MNELLNVVDIFRASKHWNCSSHRTHVLQITESKQDRNSCINTTSGAGRRQQCHLQPFIRERPEEAASRQTTVSSAARRGLPLATSCRADCWCAPKIMERAWQQVPEVHVMQQSKTCSSLHMGVQSVENQPFMKTQR